MRLLLTGDLHIGRVSARMPDALPLQERSATGAWRRIVDLAIREQVSAVCLAGDVADQDNRFWEAMGPLEEGIAELARNGVRVIAVAGNHDHEVLTRLADHVAEDGLTLLGRGGRWERTTLQDGDGRPGLHVDGWSFPKARVKDDPLATYDLPNDRDVPILGLVHGDLDVRDSPYAPLNAQQLAQSAPDAWLLGHVHAPRLQSLGAKGWALYPGSPQALDPGEPQRHGPWILELAGGMLGRPVQRPLSTVWYDAAEVDLTGVDDEDHIAQRVHTVVRREAERIVADAAGILRHVSLRLRLVGATPVTDRVASALRGLTEDFEMRLDTVVVAVDTVTNETLPQLDLAQHAKTRSAPGALASLLLELEADGASDETMALLRDARAAVREVDRNRAFSLLPPDAPTEAEVRDVVREQAEALLRALMREGP